MGISIKIEQGQHYFFDGLKIRMKKTLFIFFILIFGIMAFHANAESAQSISWIERTISQNERLGNLLVSSTYLILLSIPTLLLFRALHRRKIPLEKTDKGWIETRNSLYEHAGSVLSIILVLLFTLYAIIFFFVPNTTISKTQILLGALLVILSGTFIPSFFFSYLPSIRFNSSCLEYKALNKKISVSWKQVSEIKMSVMGPKIITLDVSFYISPLRRGFFQLIETAENQGVKIQDKKVFKLPSPSGE